MNLGYTGKPYDTTTGLYNYGYRDYKPEAARFTTVDPVRDGANWFAYVNNDPVNYVDLWGLLNGYHIAAAGAALGAAVVTGVTVAATAASGGTAAVAGPVAATVVDALMSTAIAFWVTGNIQDSLSLSKANGEKKPETQMKPDDAPTGTVPIDKAGLDTATIHEIKKKAGLQPADWTGMSKDDDVIVNDGTGKAENLGPYKDLTQKGYGR
jgi:RHS repeat-associated protein